MYKQKTSGITTPYLLSKRFNRGERWFYMVLCRPEFNKYRVNGVPNSFYITEGFIKDLKTILTKKMLYYKNVS